MIIHCGKCDTKYRLDESRLEKNGSRVRCSSCGDVFTAYPPGAPDAESLFEETPDLTDFPDPSTLYDDAPDPAGTQERDGDARRLFGLEKDGGETREPPGEDSGPRPEFDIQGDFSDPENDFSDPPPKKRSPAALFLMVLSLLAIFAGAFYGGFFMLNRMGVSIPDLRIPYLGAWFETTPRDQAEFEMETLEVHSKTVLNPMAGKLLVITGMVRGAAPGPGGWVEATARFYTSEKKILAQKTSVCGNLLSDMELAGLDMPEIDKRLLKKPDMEKPDDASPPGDTLPFMIVSRDIPGNVEMFRVEARAVSGEKK
ncbi:hypothetical protein EPICR_30185 [Candidatus Desulfarcum epimagneticum]|uniref:Zinc finger/thioredoxin putative domain-containing protein n=1 Tax=uncultured Desulfobacteraceae bacterium TaxID=218296 RepID=A0A484HGB3_9BACT|nr:hypothetical protein EPICR_30185 [uncultured Desulfobacteraceae bacterium]